MSDPHTRLGRSLALTGSLVLSFDTLVLRLIGDAPLTIAVWRGFLMAGAGVVIWAVPPLFGRKGPPLPLTPGGLAASVFYGIASVCFVGGVLLTDVANLLFIVATAPLWAAVGAALCLREPAPLGTWLASLAALGGIVLVVDPRFAGGLRAGDLLALGAALSMAAAFIVSRAAQTNLMLAPAAGGFLSALAVLPFVPHLGLAGPSQTGFMILEGGVLIPLALGLIALAPRYVSAPQVGLFLLIETALGPFWIWLAFADRPAPHVLAGGAIVVVSLVAEATLPRILPVRQRA